ncbi:hypothetical protein [Galactobacter valiniphilus]|uniref:hypothetical protein n=1 Tax=Galactobacter valiniphilus TaxID=2676122 RepID=UPI0011C39A73|nr:hypothetical protein [Galactobacter valiniphilus]
MIETNEPLLNVWVNPISPVFIFIGKSGVACCTPVGVVNVTLAFRRSDVTAFAPGSNTSYTTVRVLDTSGAYEDALDVFEEPAFEHA